MSEYCINCNTLARQTLAYSEGLKALRSDRDEALQWIRELLPEVENLYGGCGSWERALAECRVFLGRER